MGGFVRNNILKLKFEDAEFEGLEIRARQASIRQLAEWVDGPDADAPQKEQLANVVHLLAAGLISWNLETDDGGSIPCEESSLWQLDGPFLRAIAHAWMEASAGVTVPLDRSSSGGQPSPEDSIPMEVL